MLQNFHRKQNKIAKKKKILFTIPYSIKKKLIKMSL